MRPLTLLPLGRGRLWGETMNIYIICPVRGVPGGIESIRLYVADMRARGHSVHYPPDSVDQNDPNGLSICVAHLSAMRRADEVHVFWDVESKGSHFDLGMAFALGKKIKPISHFRDDNEGKSYWKMMNAYSSNPD